MEHRNQPAKANTAAAVFDTKYPSPAIGPEKIAVKSTKSVRCSVPDGQDVPADKICADQFLGTPNFSYENLPEFYDAKRRRGSSM